MFREVLPVGRSCKRGGSLMGITIDDVAKQMEALELKFKKRDEEHLVFAMRMKRYRDPDGDDGLGLVIRLSENGGYFELFAPQAFKAVGPHVDAFLKACAMMQWRTKLIQFEYDASDGEIRPIIEFPIEDGTLTQKQLSRCIGGICQLVDDYYEPLKRALGEGVVEFPERGQEMGRMVSDAMQEMVAGLLPEARDALMRWLTEGAAATGAAGASAPAAPGPASGEPPSTPPTEL